MASARAVNRRAVSAFSFWLPHFVAVAFFHAVLSYPAMMLILALLYGAEGLAAVVAWAYFFPCMLLWEFGLLRTDTPFDGPPLLVLPINSLLWALVVIPLAIGIRRLRVWCVACPRPPGELPQLTPQATTRRTIG
jgi:hypothetical protein